MGWLDAFQNCLVAIDTAPVIYFIERHPKYVDTVRTFFQGLDRGEFRAISSVVTLLEVLVVPLRAGNNQIANEYRRLLTQSSGLESVPVSLEIAESAALLRSKHNLKTPDSIQLATALCEGASTILTNDLRWPQLPGLTVLTVDSLISSPPAP